MEQIFQFIIPVFGFFSVLLVTLAIPAFLGNRAGEVLEHWEQANQQMLEDLFIIDIYPREIVIYSGIGAAVVCVLMFVISGNFIFSIVSGIGVLFLPGPIFSHLKEARLHQFESQLPAVLDQMVSAARAGLSLVQVLEEVAKSAPAPASDELKLIMHNYRLGMDLETVIEMARTRMQSNTFNLVATALIVNREKGGDLPEALESMSNSLKEVWRLEQKLFTASVEGRKSIRIIAAMPILLALMMMAFQPEMLGPLLTSFMGWVLLFISGLLYSLGLWWLSRILRINV